MRREDALYMLHAYKKYMRRKIENNNVWSLDGCTALYTYLLYLYGVQPMLFFVYIRAYIRGCKDAGVFANVA